MGNFLFRLALIISLIGIFTLIMLSNSIEPRLIFIKDINKKDIEEFIKIKGSIINIKNIENITILEIDDKTGKIKAILYDRIELKKNLSVEIIGRLTDFNGNLEIDANKIKMIN